MSSESKLSQASFSCEHCQKIIFIPIGLPVTKAPCPHCGKEVTSPDQSKAPEDKAATTTEPAKEQPVRLEPELEPARNPSQKDDAGPSPMPQAEDASPGQPEYIGKKQGRGNTVAVITAVVILLLAGGITIWLAQQWKKDQEGGKQAGKGENSAGNNAEAARDAWVNNGWKKEASALLKAFTMAKSPQERMKYVIPNEDVAEELKMYYSGGKDDSDTPVESFVHVTGSRQDHERGIFLMQYRQPSQISIREYFAPIGSLEAVLGQKETSMLELVHRIDEDNLSEPVGINAFFKEIDGELKLDSSVFIQGKYRTFKLFTSYPQPGKSKIFRVVVSESLSHRYLDDSTIRTYQFQDFAYPKDFVSLPIEVDSEVGKDLSELNWHGENRNRTYKTATVALGWTDERPSKLVIKRLICWEFLGVGGQVGNVSSKSSEPTPGTEPSAGDE